jgi:hypothetical protein
MPRVYLPFRERTPWVRPPFTEHADRARKTPNQGDGGAEDADENPEVGE